tara:strand:- start:21 stop:245 length:225 start_codon:yes stop_codon:yes gene_type:complete
MRTGSARALVEMDNELTTIVKKLAQLYPNNRHLKSDFSMVRLARPRATIPPSGQLLPAPCICVRILVGLHSTIA